MSRITALSGTSIHFPLGSRAHQWLLRISASVGLQSYPPQQPLVDPGTVRLSYHWSWIPSCAQTKEAAGKIHKAKTILAIIRCLSSPSRVIWSATRCAWSRMSCASVSRVPVESGCTDVNRLFHGLLPKCVGLLRMIHWIDEFSSARSGAAHLHHYRIANFDEVSNVSGLCVEASGWQLFEGPFIGLFAVACVPGPG